MDKLKEIKTQRANLKRKLTKTINKVERHLIEEEFDKVKNERKLLREAFDDFNDCCDNLISQLDDEDEIIKAEEHFQEVETKYICALKSIKSNNGNNSDKNSELLHVLNLPKVEIPVFRGKPDKYHEFISLFDELVHNVISDDQIKLTRLIQYTEGRARDAISSCSLIGGNEGYSAARQILHERFGNDIVVFQRIMADINSHKNVKSPVEMRDYSDFLSNSVSILKKLNMYVEVDTIDMQLQIISKYPQNVVEQWKHKAFVHKSATNKYPCLAELQTFLRQLSDEYCDPVLSQLSNLTKETSRMKVSNHATSVVKCDFCDFNHLIRKCFKFKAKSIDERLKLVREENL